jgi:hypothetical protein
MAATLSGHQSPPQSIGREITAVQTNRLYDVGADTTSQSGKCPKRSITGLPKQLRQPRDVDGDPSRLVRRQHLAGLSLWQRYFSAHLRHQARKFGGYGCNHCCELLKVRHLKM